jgi:glycosyltransferase involved in cell wall biosynthesis
LREYIKNKKLNKHILLLGEIDENKKITLMQECTIYFQISKYEGFDLTIAEAMACGAPVITSDVGEVSNVVGNAGIICKDYKLNKIVEEINLLLNNKERRKDLSKHARMRILENFQYSRRLKDINNCLLPSPPHKTWNDSS